MPLMRLERSLAVVTGASSGLGREFARQLAARGWPVLAVARRGDRLDELAAEAARAGWACIHPAIVDLRAHDAASVIVARARELGEADLLVNNAGTAHAGPLVTSDALTQLDQIRVNCEALVTLAAAFAPEMVSRGRGTILNVASISAFQPTPGFAVYGATKAFIVSFSEALREELRGTGVHVCAFCAPSVQTELVQRAVPPGTPRGRMLFAMSAERCVTAALAGAEGHRHLLFASARDRVVTAVIGLLPRAVVARMARSLSLRWVGLPPLEAWPVHSDTSGDSTRATFAARSSDNIE